MTEWAKIEYSAEESVNALTTSIFPASKRMWKIFDENLSFQNLFLRGVVSWKGKYLALWFKIMFITDNVLLWNVIFCIHIKPEIRAQSVQHVSPK